MSNVEGTKLYTHKIPKRVRRAIVILLTEEEVLQLRDFLLSVVI